MNFRFAACLLIFASLGRAQEPKAQEPKLYDEKQVQGVMRHHGLSGLAAPYRAKGETEIETLAPLLIWLSERYGHRSGKAAVNAPLRSLDEPIEAVIREDNHRKVFNGVWVHVRLMDTIEDAGKAAAIYLSGVPVLFDKGSFSGMTVGDWTARFDAIGPPTLMFTRKNAFVRVSCNRAIEILKSDKSQRGFSDSGIKEKCEDLAREIDAQLDRLPGRKRE